MFRRDFQIVPSSIPDDTLIVASTANETLLLRKENDSISIPTRRDLASFFGVQSSGKLDPIQLGTVGCSRVLAIFISDKEKEKVLSSFPGRFEPIRTAKNLVAPEDFVYIWLGFHLVQWHHSSQFCGYCGSPMSLFKEAPASTWQKRCCDPACTSPGLFPRTNPCVIASIVRPPTADCPMPRILLVGSRARPGMFTINAGFVEACESLEQAVAREIREEVGIEVTHLRYFGSSSWAPSCSLIAGPWLLERDRVLQR